MEKTTGGSNKILLAAVICSIAACSFSYTQAGTVGVNLAYGTGKLLKLDNLHDTDGFRGAITYAPSSSKWQYISIHYSGAVAYWHTSKTPVRNSAITIYSLAPIAQFKVFSTQKFIYSLELSVGVSYLSKTVFANNSLGINFAFQDMFGIAVSYNEKFSAGVRIMHYSNAGISNHNRGITIPLLFNIGYQFTA